MSLECSKVFPFWGFAREMIIKISETHFKTFKTFKSTFLNSRALFLSKLTRKKLIQGLKEFFFIMPIYTYAKAQAAEEISKDIKDLQTS
jgi:hypothetical protein